VRKSKFTDDQIAFALKQAELGISVEEVCRKMGISDATFYIWRKKYGGVGPSELRRLRQLEEENRKLKQIVADLSLDKAVLQAVVAEKCLRPSQRRDLVPELMRRFGCSQVTVRRIDLDDGLDGQAVAVVDCQ
jgi:putative transposase